MMNPPVEDTEHLNTTPPPPFIVDEHLSKIYYNGLPSRPRFIATTKSKPYEPPVGPEAYSIRKELRILGLHALAESWDIGLGNKILEALSGVNWTCVDALRIAEVGKPSSTAIVWIGVMAGALSFEEGSAVARRCHQVIVAHNIDDCEVEIRESHVMRQLGIKFLNPVYTDDPTYPIRDAYTALLGTPISAMETPHAQGSGGFFISAGGEDKNIYIVTARHVLIPFLDEADNKDTGFLHGSEERQDVIILSPFGFRKQLADIDDEIKDARNEVKDTEQRLKNAQDRDDKLSVERQQTVLKEKEWILNGLTAFRDEIAGSWDDPNSRIFGRLVWAPPIAFSTERGKYTLDLAVIQVDPGKLDSHNFRGNTINLSRRYTARQIEAKIYLDPSKNPENNPTEYDPPFRFEVPVGRLFKLEGQPTPKSDITKMSMLDKNKDECLPVFKYGAASGLTFGRANNVSSYTRNYYPGHSADSREWAVIPTDGKSGAFSEAGDSGSCVADAFGRIGGMLTGGAGSPLSEESVDVTYVTPAFYIMEALRKTELFKNAHLNPVVV